MFVVPRLNGRGRPRNETQACTTTKSLSLALHASTPQAHTLPMNTKCALLPSTVFHTYPPPSRAVRHVHKREAGRQHFVVDVDDLNVNRTGARFEIQTEFRGEKTLQMMHRHGGRTLQVFDSGHVRRIGVVGHRRRMVFERKTEMCIFCEHNIEA